MEKIALKIAYLGTDFYGFQRQPNLQTIENELLTALQKARLIKNLSEADYSSAARTDRGVHALGQVVAFNTPTPEKTRPSHINQFLPPDIWVYARAIPCQKKAL